MTPTQPGRLLGTGKEAEVFEFGNHVLKLYRTGIPKTSAFREAANLALAGARGLSAPSVVEVAEHDGRWGIVMSRATGRSFADAIRQRPEAAPEYLRAMAGLQLQVHGEPGTGLSSLKARLSANIRKATVLGDERRQALLAALQRLPDSDKLCHGDFHPWNVLGSPRSAVIVDWLDACSGPPAADVCRSYVLMQHASADLASTYVETYAGLAGQSRGEVLIWLPLVAAARLAEGVPDEVDALTEMAGRL
jgi:aminoglycoside phosphotransferase (APT) family kinase protein